MAVPVLLQPGLSAVITHSTYSGILIAAFIADFFLSQHEIHMKYTFIDPELEFQIIGKQ